MPFKSSVKTFLASLYLNRPVSYGWLLMLHVQINQREETRRYNNAIFSKISLLVLLTCLLLFLLLQRLSLDLFSSFHEVSKFCSCSTVVVIRIPFCSTCCSVGGGGSCRRRGTTNLQCRWYLFGGGEGE